jgi:hypothetical protein
LDTQRTNAQNTEDGEKLMNSPTLGLKEMAGTIMTELEKNENVREVVVHVRVVRLPKGGKKGKKNAKAQVSTMSYKFDINQAIFHKMLAKRRQQQRKLLLARRSSSLLTPTGYDAAGNMSTLTIDTGAAAEQGGPSQDPMVTRALTAIAASNVSEPQAIACAPFSFPAISTNQRGSFISSSRITRVHPMPSHQQEVSAIENLPLLPYPNLAINFPTVEELPSLTHTADLRQPEERDYHQD